MAGSGDGRPWLKWILLTAKLGELGKHLFVVHGEDAGTLRSRAANSFSAAPVTSFRSRARAAGR